MRETNNKSEVVMANKPAKSASLLAPTSEETYGSLLECLNGNAVHTERGVNFTRVSQSACQIFWAHVGGKRQQFIQSLSSRSIGCPCSLYLTDLKRTELALNYNLQLSGKGFFVFFFSREQAVHVCVWKRQLLPELTMGEIWENIPKIQSGLNMRL